MVTSSWSEASTGWERESEGRSRSTCPRQWWPRDEKLDGNVFRSWPAAWRRQHSGQVETDGLQVDGDDVSVVGGWKRQGWDWIGWRLLRGQFSCETWQLKLLVNSVVTGGRNNKKTADGRQ